jgi:catechol 2,3-dioxygenase-like lactoylglutathione lyase family enzyme
MIRSLQHVALTVPDLEVGRAFYTAFGLEARPLGDDLVFRCAGRPQDQVRLTPGSRKRLHYVSFGTRSAELPGLKQRLERRGIKLVDAPAGEDGDGIWFRDPDGDLINIRAAEDAQQARTSLPVNAPGDYRRLGQRGVALAEPGPVMPRRLGHLIKFSTNVPRAIEFYTEVCGMKLSDRAGDVLAFLRCGNGGDHHVLGFGLSEGTGLHHLSFEVGSLEELHRGAGALLEAGYRQGFGPGRHVLGSNYFHYLRDPWMSLVEYFWDIDYIPEGAPWEPANMELGPRAVAQWAASPPPEDFVRNFELG